MNNLLQMITRIRSAFCVLLLGFLLLFLAGCAMQRSSVPLAERWASVEGGQIQESRPGEQFFFTIPVDEGLIAEGVPITIAVSGNVASGSVRFELRRPDGQAVWNSGTIGPGDFSIRTEYTLPVGQTGTYTLGLVYTEQTSVTYNLSWHALRLGPAILLPGFGMVLVGLAFVFFASWRQILNWRYLMLGGLFWVLTVTAKFTVSIPLNPLVFQALGVTSEKLFSPGNLAAYLYIGALTGIFEVGLAWLVLSKTRWGRADWSQALIFGIGFGVIEALLLGLAGLSSALVGLFSPEVLPVPTLGTLAGQTSLGMGLAPVVERLFVVLAHIFACLLIFYAIARREARWGWLAMLYKTLLDTPAGFAAFWGTGTVAKIWTIEAVIALFGILGLWGTLQVARRYPRASVENGTHTRIDQSPRFPQA